MTTTTERRDGVVLLVTVLLASSLPAIARRAPALPDAVALAPAVALTALVGVVLAGYQHARGDIGRFRTTRSRALLHAVFAFYVTATLTVVVVAVRLGGDQLRSLPVVAWTVLSSGAVAVIVRRRIRASERES